MNGVTPPAGASPAARASAPPQGADVDHPTARVCTAGRGRSVGSSSRAGAPPSRPRQYASSASSTSPCNQPPLPERVVRVLDRQLRERRRPALEQRLRRALPAPASGPPSTSRRSRCGASSPAARDRPPRAGARRPAASGPCDRSNGRSASFAPARAPPLRARAPAGRAGRPSARPLETARSPAPHTSGPHLEAGPQHLVPAVDLAQRTAQHVDTQPAPRCRTAVGML